MNVLAGTPEPAQARRAALGFKAAVALVVGAAHVAIFDAVGAATPAPSGAYTTRLDELIPFWPWTVWLYIFGYVLVLVLAVAVVPTRRTFLRAVAAALAVTLIACVVFALAPSSYPRPPLVDDGSWTMRFLAFVRDVDSPNNTLPSLHVALMLTVALAVREDDARWGRRLLALTVPCALSILTVKQHYVVDLIAGAALASAVHVVVFAPLRRPRWRLRWRPPSRARSRADTRAHPHAARATALATGGSSSLRQLLADRSTTTGR